MKQLYINIFLAALLCCSLSANAITRYVNATRTDNTGNGLTWATAKRDLQVAINAATSGDEIWVAAGTYKPTHDPYFNATPTDPRNKTFYIKDGVKIYGGFYGDEATLAARHGAISFLNGDIGTIGGNLDNCYHVVISAGSTGVTIDGFTVTNGNANGLVYITLNTYFLSQSHGAGIALYGGVNEVTNNIITNNKAKGGIGSNGTSASSDKRGQPGGNAHGAGVYTYEASSAFKNNFIINNEISGGKGGNGYYSFDGGVGGNAFGAGMYILNGANVFINNVFSTNICSGGNGGEGGAADFGSPSAGIGGNGGHAHGGAIYTVMGSNSFVNNTYSSNSLFGGIGGGNGGTIGIDKGGAIYTYNGTNVVKNCIFSNNSKRDGVDISGADIENNISTNTVSNSILQLNSIYSSDASNLTTNPLFLLFISVAGADGIYRTADDGLYLQNGSPAINAGTLTGAPTTDILGVTRVGNPDMGAYENINIPCVIPTTYTTTGGGAYCGGGIGVVVGLSNSETGVSYQLKNGAANTGAPITGTGAISFGNQTAAGTYTVVATRTSGGCTAAMAGSAIITTTISRLYVNKTATGANNGLTWADAYVNLQDAIDAANTACNTEIWVAAGTYFPTKDVYGSPSATSRYNTFYLKDKTKVYGGFFGDETTLAARHGDETILSGDYNNDDVVTGTGASLAFSNNAENVFHVVVSINDDNTTLLNRFTIKGGNADFNGGTITVETRTFTYNKGGNIFIAGSAPTISECNILYGYALFGGGGLYCGQGQGSNINLDRLVFYKNIGQSEGGAIENENNIISTLHNSLFIDNKGADGAAIANRNTASITAKGCVFYKNYARGQGTLYNVNPSCSATITNSIFWENDETNTTYNIVVGGGLTLTYSIVQDGYAGIGNSSANPLFINAADPDGADNIWCTTDDGLHIAYCSPAVDAGDNTATTITTDITGLVRKFDVAFITNTGNGTSPIVDMGAYENRATTTATFAPSISIAVSPSNTIISGTSVTFTATIADGGSPPVYQWYLNNVAVGTNVATYTNAALANSDIIKCRLTPNNLCVTNTPLNSNTVTMSVIVCPTTTHLYVKPGGIGNGSTWTDAMGDLQAAIDNFCNIDSIFVLQGTYKPIAYPTGCTTCSNTRDYAFMHRNGRKLFGGFTTTERHLSQRLPAFMSAGGGSILSGDFNGDDAANFTNNTDNAYHVLIGVNATNAATRLDGFTVTGGNANSNTAATIAGITINKNKGGGIYSHNSTITITNALIKANTCLVVGGGMFTENIVIVLDKVVFADNRSDASGGGIGGENTLTLRLTNCVFANNNANSWGGAVYTSNNVNMTNTTLYANTATTNGGGMYAPNPTASIYIKNCIVWANTGGGTASLFTQVTPNVSYSLVQGATVWAGTSNKNTDPYFINPADGDGADNTWFTADDGLGITACSPALNAGINTDAPTTDIINGAMFGTTKDMGAYELQSVESTPSAAIMGVVTVCAPSTAVVYTATAVSGTPTYNWSYTGTGATFASTTNSVSINFAANATNGTLKVATNLCPTQFTTFDISITRPDASVTEAATCTNNVLTAVAANMPNQSVLNFNATNHSGTLPLAVNTNAFNSADGFTVEAWVNEASVTQSDGRLLEASNTPNGTGVIDGNITILLSSGATGKPAFALYNGSTRLINLISSTALVNNTWAHVAYTYTRSTGVCKIYINGIERASGISAAQTTISRPYIKVIRGTGNTGNSILAKIDELRIWNKPRTAAEILATKNYAIATNANLIGNYHCDENTASAIAASSNGNNMTLLNSVPFVNTGMEPLSNQYTYAWTGGNVTNTLTATTSGTYTLTVTDGVSGCMGSTSTAISIGAPANAGADVTLTCSTPSTTLSATGGTSYAWNNGVTQGDIVSPAVTTIYTVTVTNATGCVGTDAIVVTVNKTAPTANAGADITLTCTTPSTTLSATGGTSYAWNNGVTQGDIVSPAVTTTYTVTVTNAIGCVGTDAIVVTVNKTMPLGYTVTGGGAYCTGGAGVAVGLNNSEVGVSYQLRKDGTNVGAPIVGTGAGISFGLQTAAGSYNVWATRISNGCGRMMLGPQFIAISPPPTVNIAGVTTACGTVSLTASGGNTYAWNGGATPTTAQNAFSASGIYTVTVTNMAGCMATQSVNVTIGGSSATINLTGATTACENTTLTASTAATNLNVSALSFDAIDDYGELPPTVNTDAFNSANGFTVEAWVNPSVSTNAWQRLIDVGNGAGNDNIVCALSHNVSGYPVFDLRNGSNVISSIIANTALADNTWTHVAFTYDRMTGDVYIYINGLIDVYGTTSEPLNTTTRTNAYVGKSNWPDALFDGGIDELRIWSIARTDTEIANNKDYSITTAAGLVANYHCDENAPSNITASINSNNMPLINGVAFTNTMPLILDRQTYAWSGGATPTTAENTFSASGIYTVVVTNTAGCTASTSTTVSITTMPTVTTSGGGSICHSAALPNVHFNFTGTPPYTFTYTDGGTPTTITAHPTNIYTIADADEGVYHVTALSNGACVGTNLGNSTHVTLQTTSVITAITSIAENFCASTGMVLNAATNITNTNALIFDGTDDYATLPDIVNTNAFNSADGFTVETWVKPIYATNNWQRLVDIGNGADADNIVCALSQGGSGNPIFDLRNGNTVLVTHVTQLPLKV